MNEQEAKIKAQYFIDKAKKATTYQYQECAGACSTTFEHDIDTLKQIALITIKYITEHLPKWERMEDTNTSIKNRELVFWELVKIELDKLK